MGTTIESGRDRSVTDEQAVKSLYLRLMKGWNQGSARAFVEPMAEDVDFVPFDGVYFKGRDALAGFHEPLFQTHLKGTRLVGEVTSVRFLAPDVALIHAVGGTVLPGKTEPSPERDSIQTLVARRQAGEWRLAAFQNTRVRPIGRNFAGTMWWLLTDWLWKFVRPKS